MPSEPLVTAIVLGTFGLLFVRKIGLYPLSRSITAAVGAVVVILIGAISPSKALASIDAGTILLLFGMLAHVEALAQSGFYGWAATQLVQRTGTPRRLTLGALGLSAAMSAVALNDATVILLTPVLIQAVRGADLDPVPPLVAVVLGANIGSLATPLGNPQNAYILSHSPLTTVKFVRVLAPVAVLGLGIAGVMMFPLTDGRSFSIELSAPDLDRAWAVSSGGFLLLTVVLLAALPGVNPGVIAASIGVLHIAWVQLFRRVPGNEILGHIDWDIIVLFVGIFVLVGGLEGTVLVRTLETFTQGWPLAGATFVLSNLMSNVPAVVLLSTAITDQQGWYILAAVSTLAGNATPIASAATLIVLDQTSRNGVTISVRRLIRIGLPVAVVTSVAAVIVIQYLM
ncbi:ArsB/NhaD family transporter [Halococcus thailandensis]